MKGISIMCRQPRYWPVAAVGAFLAYAMLAWIAAVPAAACTNESIRLQQGSTYLPDCRAFELASPGSNPLVNNVGYAERTRAATDGGEIAYFSDYPAKEATRGGFYYLARRGSGGWSTEEVAPQDSPQGAALLECSQSVYFSADLSRSVLSDGWNAEEQLPGESYCQSSEETLAAGAPSGFENLFWREGTAAYRLVNVTPEGSSPSNALLQAATGDFSRVLFAESAKLTPEAPVGYDLYEWVDGTVHLPTFLPEGKPVVGKLADGGARTGIDGVFEGQQYALAPVMHAVSADGERVFFYAEHEGGVNLYLRENAAQPQSAVVGSKVNGEQCTEPAKACTVQIDVSQGPGSSGGGVFWDASEGGGRVFFADEKPLTTGSVTASGKPALYEYDVETRMLTDVSPSSGEAANVRGLSGASEDGSYVYFVATAKLTGAQQNSEGAVAQSFKPNLYLYHEDVLTFIATLQQFDESDWQESGNPREENRGFLSSRVSPNGLYIGFESVNKITGFDNTDANTGKPDDEIYLYGASDSRLACVSCSPTGEKPIGRTQGLDPMQFSVKSGGQPVYLPRNVLDDGRVFFATPSPLVSQDINGVADVYEFENGQAFLLSSGANSSGSTFYDASADGRDAFFVTAQGLVGSDTDNNDSLYDAREGGGFLPGPGEAVEPEACASEGACRQPAHEAPAEQFAGSSTLSSPGNLLVPPPKPEEPIAKKPTKRSLTRAQKLANALKACRKQSESRRRACEASAHRRYGPKSKSKAKRGGRG